MHQTAFKIIKGNPFHCKLLMLELLECNISFFSLSLKSQMGNLAQEKKKRTEIKHGFIFNSAIKMNEVM